MTDLTSLQNPRVKYVVKLRTSKRQRLNDKVMLVEGRYELELALASGIRPVEVFHCAELAGGQVPGLDLEPATVSRPVFEKMSHREGPDGWLAIIPTPQRTFDSLTLSATPFLILAEAVEKPGNLGAMLRTADAAGVDGLLVCEPRVDLYNPNVVRASRGTLFTVPAVETDNRSALDWLRGRGVQILAATPHTDNLYTEVDLRGPVCLAVGSEDAGLSDFWMEQADLKVRIPMAGRVNSLNVSTSTAILAYEVVRQRSP